MKDCKETIQQNTETQRHDEIYMMLAEMKITIEEIKVKFEQYEPVLDYLNKGSIAGKAVLSILKWSAATVITLGGVAGAWMAIKAMIHGQN